MYPFKPFEDCLEKITYTTKIQRKDFLESGDFPIVSQEAGDINGYWDNKSDVFEINKPVIIFGDHTKIVKYIDFDFVLGADGVKILQPKDFLDTRYFCYFLQSIELKSLGYARHYRLLRELNIPLPPLSIQLDIVARLDSAMAEIETLRAETESALASTRELWESTLESVFVSEGKDWEEKTFEDICEISSKLIDPKEEQYHSFLHVGGANIESITGKLIDLKTAKEEKLISGKFLFDENIVLYSKIRPYLIKVTRPDFVGLCSADIYPLSPKKNILNKDFLYYILISKNFTDYAIKGSARAGMPKVNREHLFAYNVFLSPLLEQSRIVAHLDAVRVETERLEKIYKEKLASLDELRRSVLAEAFS